MEFSIPCGIVILDGIIFVVKHCTNKFQMFGTVGEYFEDMYVEAQKGDALISMVPYKFCMLLIMVNIIVCNACLNII